MKSNYILNWILAEKYKLLFIILIAFYIIQYAPNGFTELDDGFITSLSWRIYNGEIPYRDFIYVRPPLTILLHTLPFYLLPHDLIIISERILFFLSISASCFFASKSISSIVDLRKYNIDVYLIASIGYVFSINSFTPMAWHTVDGILFGSIGIYLLITKKSLSGTSLGVLFLLLAALTKQSFYLLPFAGLGYLISDKRGIKTVSIATLTILVSILFFVLILFKFQVSGEFVSQTIGATSFRDAYTSGVYVYVHSEIIFYLFPIVVWKIWDLFAIKSKWQTTFSYIPYIFVTFVFVYTISFYLNALFFKDLTGSEYLELRYMDPLARIGFIFSFVYLLFVTDNRKFVCGMALLLSLSWSASISWAHTSPHLFATPIMVIFLLSAKEYFFVKKPEKFASFLLGIGLVVYLIAYQKPFYNDTKENMVYDLGKVHSQLSFVLGDERIYSKHIELDSLVSRYGTNFKVLPAMPIANMLYKKSSPVSIDWALNCEVAGQDERLFRELETSKAIVFIDKRVLLEEFELKDEHRKYGSLLTMRIAREWQKIDSLRHFYVYKNFGVK